MPLVVAGAADPRRSLRWQVSQFERVLNFSLWLPSACLRIDA